MLQCRGHEITEGMHPQYGLFKQWTAVKRPALEAMLGGQFILYGECASYNAWIEIVYREPKLDVILDRNRRRTTPVPEGVILRLAGKLEPPTSAEAHKVTFLADQE